MTASFEKPKSPSQTEIIIAQKNILLERTEGTQRYVQRGPRISLASDGTPRMRAYLLDEDAYMGYLEHTAYVGVAFMPEEVVIEVYYPHSASKTHKWYSFNEQTGVATKHTETIDTAGHSELPIEPTLAEVERNMQDIIWYLRELDDDLVSTFESQHEEDKRRQNWNGEEPFMFQLEQLQ